MSGFWGYALLMVFAVTVTASLVAAVVRVLLFAERKEAERRARAGTPTTTSRRVGAPPAREALTMTPEQTREFEKEWSSLVTRLR